MRESLSMQIFMLGPSAKVYSHEGFLLGPSVKVYPSKMHKILHISLSAKVSTPKVMPEFVFECH